MVAYYSENNAYAAQWLRHLIAEGLIAAGDVDTRSIVDVRADDIRQYEQCHFFAGIGGWSHALRLAGWPDDRAVWTGSCPCQPFSSAGKRQGFADERHLWPVWRDLIREQRPAVVFGEQVASAADWVRLVRSDLEAVDYAVGILPVEAASAGAFHLRDRFWFVGDAEHGGRQRRHPEWSRPNPALPPSKTSVLGDTSGARLPFPKFEALRRTWWRQEGRAASEPSRPSGALANADSSGRIKGNRAAATTRYGSAAATDGGELDWYVSRVDGKARPVEPGIRLLADGVPKRVDKLRSLGNAIVPQAAAQFIAAYMEGVR